jgi:hypothetical protein
MCNDQPRCVHAKGREERDEVIILRCPHCDRDIELVDTRVFEEEYGLGPNVLTLARQKGELPEPAFGGPSPQKFYWTRQQADEFAEERRQKRLAKLLEGVQSTLDELPEAEREEAIKMLAGDKRKR